MVNELPNVLRGYHDDIRIAPDIKTDYFGLEPAQITKSVGTDELEEIIKGLQYYAKRLDALKRCVQNAHDERTGLVRSELQIIQFPKRA